MTKKEWQVHHGITDTELAFIEAIIFTGSTEPGTTNNHTTTNTGSIASIVLVSPLPLNKNGSPVPFSDRR